MSQVEIIVRVSQVTPGRRRPVQAEALAIRTSGDKSGLDPQALAELLADIVGAGADGERLHQIIQDLLLGRSRLLGVRE